MLNEERTKPRMGVIVGILFGVCCVGYGYFYLVSTMFDSDATGECKAIAAMVESASSIPMSVSVPGHPAVFCQKDVRGVLLRPF